MTAKFNPEQKFAEQFRSGGELPSGPVSPWPQDREILPREHFTGHVKASAGDMAKGLLRTAALAAANGRVTAEVREERLKTCIECPHFIEGKARCSLCGCFMKAKTWVKADPNQLCPAKKWDR